MYQEWHFYGFQFIPPRWSRFPISSDDDQQLQFRFLSHPKSAFVASHLGVHKPSFTKFRSMLVPFSRLEKSVSRFTITTTRLEANGRHSVTENRGRKYYQMYHRTHCLLQRTRFTIGIERTIELVHFVLLLEQVIFNP